MTTTLPIKDGNNNSQTLITNTVSSNQMPVHNIGDPVTSNSVNVTGSPASSNSLQVSLAASSGNIGPICFFNDAVAGTAVQVKSSSGNIYALDLVNTTGATAYLQVYFKPSASVTVGTTGADMILRLGASASKTFTLGGLPIGASGTGLTLAGTTTQGGSTGAAISASVYYN